MTTRRELANAIRERFGASGNGADVLPHFGFAADNIVQQIRESLEGA